MKRYESYKDSGVKWLGEIPGHWEVRKLKFVTKYIFLGKTPKYSLIENKYKIIGQKCNQLDGIKMCDCKYAEENFYHERKEYEFLLHGDVLLNSLGGGSVGRIGYYNLKEHGVLTDGHIIVIRNKPEFNSRFLYYFLSTKRKDFETMASGSTNQMFLLVSDINKQFVPLPPKSEQTAIANYLNSVTSKIDEAISQQQKMIDLLNERKQIIIQNAVTKGLDPNAKMKDSGVEWIGEIPENWEVRRIKNSCKLINKKSKEDLPYIELDNIESKSGKLLSYSNNRPDSICNHFEKGDILFCKLRPYLAKSIIAGVEGKCSSELLVLRHFLGNQKYFQYLLLSPKLIDLINESTYGAKMPRANWSYIGNCIIPIPSMVEQKRIINYLDSFTSHIDSSISQCNKMISLLQERKQIIINDVVTGKVKVV